MTSRVWPLIDHKLARGKVAVSTPDGQYDDQSRNEMSPLSLMAIAWPPATYTAWGSTIGEPGGGDNC